MAYSVADCNLSGIWSMEITSLYVAERLTKNHVISENDNKLYGPS